MFYSRELDTAIFRRLEKRIFIDLPDVRARKEMFEFYLSEMLRENKYIKCREIDSDSLAQVTSRIIVMRNYFVAPLYLYFKTKKPTVMYTGFSPPMFCFVLFEGEGGFIRPSAHQNNLYITNVSHNMSYDKEMADIQQIWHDIP